MSLAPDVALLQECRRPTGNLPGHLHVAPTRAGWGAAVWSRFPLTVCGGLPEWPAVERAQFEKATDGYVASARLVVPGHQPLLAVSAHAWPAAVRPELLTGLDVGALKTSLAKRVWPGDLLWWATRHLPGTGQSVVLGGDWNTARLFDQVYKPRGNQEFFDRMAASNWHEAVRQFHPTEQRTYFRKGRGEYQLDHVFVTADVAERLTRADVSTEGGVLRASDHAPIILEFSPPEAPTRPSRRA